MNHPFDELAFADLEASKLQKAKLFKVDTTDNPMRLTFSLQADESQSLMDFLPVDINFEPISAKGDYNNAEELVNFQLEVPQFHFSKYRLG